MILRHFWLMAAAFILALGLSAGAAADCARPDAPTVPDGDTASLEQMLEAQQAVVDYMDAGNAYLECLQKAQDRTVRAAGRDRQKREAAAEADARRVEKHNAMVEDMEAVAADFNVAREAFNAQQQ